MRIALPLLSLMMLAACGQPVTDDANAPLGNGADILTPAPANDGEVAATDNAVLPPFAETPGAHPTAPEPAPIPAKFRGTWAATKSDCRDLEHHSRLTISGRTVRFTDFVIFGNSVTVPSANEFAVKGVVKGTDHPAEAHYSLTPADVLIDEAGGGAIRVRCG